MRNQADAESGGEGRWRDRRVNQCRTRPKLQRTVPWGGYRLTDYGLTGYPCSQRYLLCRRCHVSRHLALEIETQEDHRCWTKSQRPIVERLPFSSNQDITHLVL